MEKESQCMLKRKKHDFLEDFDDFLIQEYKKVLLLKEHSTPFNVMSCSRTNRRQEKSFN